MSIRLCFEVFWRNYTFWGLKEIKSLFFVNYLINEKIHIRSFILFKSRNEFRVKYFVLLMKMAKGYFIIAHTLNDASDYIYHW